MATPITIMFDDKTVVPLSDDGHGLVARHHDVTARVSVVSTASRATTPAKWVATR